MGADLFHAEGKTDGRMGRQVGIQTERERVTDRRDEANNHVLQFCERVLK